MAITFPENVLQRTASYTEGHCQTKKNLLEWLGLPRMVLLFITRCNQLSGAAKLEELQVK